MWGREISPLNPMDREKLDIFNKFLVDKYGRIDGLLPKYRLVWSTDFNEYRRGTFGQLFGSGEDENVVRLVKKYNYCLDRWVLEKLEISKNMPKDLIQVGTTSYEPLYVFHTGEAGDYEEPTLEQIDRRVYFDVCKTLYGHTITEDKLRELDIKKREKNIANIKMRLDNELPEIPHAIKHGSAVFMDARKKMTSNAS